MKTTQKMMLNTAKRAGKHFRKNLSILKTKGVSVILAVVFYGANNEHTSYLSQTPQMVLSGVNFSRLSEKNAYI